MSYSYKGTTNPSTNVLDESNFSSAGGPSVPYNVISSFSEESEFLDRSDAENEIPGPSVGVPNTGSTFSKMKQIKSDSGDSSVSIEGGEGGERITLSHATGAGIIIDPDGSIFILPKGTKGVGIASRTGPLSLNGQKLILDGKGGIEMRTSEFRLKTTGDFNIMAGGTVNIKAGNFHQDVSGNYQNYVAGDKVEVIGGINRETVGGEKREQISSFYKLDVGDSYTLRARAESSLNFEDNVYVYTDENYTLNAGKEVNSLSGTTTTVQSKEKMSFNSETSMETTSKEDMTTTSDQKMTISSKSDIGIHTDTKSIMTASDTFEIGSDGDMKLTSSTGNLTAYGSSGAIYSSGGRTEVTAENTLQLNYSFTRAPDVSGEVGVDKTPIDGISSVASNDASDTEDVKEASKVEVYDSTTVANNITTAREFPLTASFGYGNRRYGSVGAAKEDYIEPTFYDLNASV